MTIGRVSDSGPSKHFSMTPSNFAVAVSPLHKHQKLYACLIAFAALLYLHHRAGIVTFQYDALNYWQLSEFQNLLSYPKSIRGYFYPLMLSPVRGLATLIPESDLVIFRVSSSLIFAYLLTITIPDFFANIFGGTVSLVRRVVFSLLVATIFPGLLLFPLSDLPAFILLLAAVSFALQARNSGTFWSLFLSGMLATASYNVRTIYLFSFLVLIVIVPFFLLSNKSWLARLTGLMVFLLGSLIVAAPQMLINVKTHGKVTPLVQASDASGNNPLLAAQLRWGIMIQRYETSVREDTPSATVFYLDKAATNLFATEKVEKTPTTITSYVELVLRNPGEFIGIYGRHLVNGLDVRDGMVYVRKESGRRNLFSIFNFCILFVGFFILSIRNPQKLASSRGLVIGILLIPVAAILPGAVETRFFLPLHLLVYGMIAFHFDFDAARRAIAARPILLVLSFLASLTIFMAISTSTMASVTYSWPSQYQ